MYVLNKYITCVLKFTVNLRKSFGKGPSIGGFQRFESVCLSLFLRLCRTSGNLKLVTISIFINYVIHNIPFKLKLSIKH